MVTSCKRLSGPEREALLRKRRAFFVLGGSSNQDEELAVQSARAADRAAVGSHRTVTRNDRGRRIASVRRAGPPDARRISELPRQVAAGPGLAVGNVLKQPPKAPLERITSENDLRNLCRAVAVDAAVLVMAALSFLLC
ncbi:hypothetical protein OHS16_04170 [Streptomyces sp. NBC_00344]